MNRVLLFVYTLAIPSITALGTVPQSSFKSFIEAVSSNDLVPDTTNPFDFIGSASLTQDSVIFEGSDSATNRGLYEVNPISIGTITDFTEMIPGVMDTFDQFVGQATRFGGNTIFAADGTPSTMFSGIVSLGTVNSVLIDNSATIPNTSPGVLFDSFNEPKFSSDGRFVFSASNSTAFEGGYYLYDAGTLTPIVDRTTPLPGTDTGGGNQTISESPSADFDYDGIGFVVSEVAQDLTTQGIWISPDLGALAPILTTGDNIPGTSETFSGTIGNESQVILSDGSAFFTATDGNSHQYLLMHDGMNTQIVAQTGDLVGDETIISMSSLGIEGGEGSVFFIATTDMSTSIFSLEDGMIKQVLSVGDILDGKTVSDFLFEDFNDETLLFTAEFTDASAGIYLVSVPEPSTYLLMGLGLAGVFVFYRMRQTDGH